MMNTHKHRASLLVSALVIFTFLTTIVLVIFTYANTNLNHAKRQEEGIHAYYLAYSGAEIAYASLKLEAEDIVLASSDRSKWEKLADKFSDLSFLSKHKVCISYDGKKSFSGYQTKEFQRLKRGTSGLEASQLLKELEDAYILIEVTKLPATGLAPEEAQYPGFIKVVSTAVKAEGTKFESRATKLLYIDPVIDDKVYWK